MEICVVWQQLLGALNPESPPCAIGFLCQLHFHDTNVSKRHQGHISIVLTLVFSPSPQDRMSGFNFHSYLPNFTSSLICIPIHFHFIFVLFSFPFDYCVWAQTSPGRTQHFIYILASIHFQFCFEHIKPCFTTMCNQMLRLAICWNFHTFHPCLPQKPLIFCNIY